MKRSMALPIALLAMAIGGGAAWAQYEEPLARNQSEGQLMPDQAEEVAPMEENIDQDTTPDDVPLETGAAILLYESDAPTVMAEEIPDYAISEEDGSISATVQEDQEEAAEE